MKMHVNESELPSAVYNNFVINIRCMASHPHEISCICRCLRMFEILAAPAVLKGKALNSIMLKKLALWGVSGGDFPQDVQVM